MARRFEPLPQNGLEIGENTAIYSIFEQVVWQGTQVFSVFWSLSVNTLFKQNKNALYFLVFWGKLFRKKSSAIAILLVENTVFCNVLQQVFSRDGSNHCYNMGIKHCYL